MIWFTTDVHNTPLRVVSRTGSSSAFMDLLHGPFFFCGGHSGADPPLKPAYGVPIFGRFVGECPGGFTPSFRLYLLYFFISCHLPYLPPVAYRIACLYYVYSDLISEEGNLWHSSVSQLVIRSSS